MATGMWQGISGVARKSTKAYAGIGGVARKIKKGYVGVGGVARKFFELMETLYIFSAASGWGSTVTSKGLTPADTATGDEGTGTSVSTTAGSAYIRIDNMNEQVITGTDDEGDDIWEWATSASARLNQAFDLTNYKYISVHFSYFSYPLATTSSSGVAIGISTAASNSIYHINTSYLGSGNAVQSSKTTSGWLNLDVSSKSGKYYLYLGFNLGGNTETYVNIDQIVLSNTPMS